MHSQIHLFQYTHPPKFGSITGFPARSKTGFKPTASETLSIAGVVTDVDTTAYIGSHFEWTGSTSTMKKYYYAGATRVAMRTGAGTGTSGLNFLLSDHLGSTSRTTDGSGTLQATQLYKAWGEVRWSSGSLPTRYTFTGQYTNMPEFGLMFYGARWLDPWTGRFAQADTIVPGAGNPMAWDRYAAMLNNPVRYTDPSGHSVACDDGNESCAIAQAASTKSRESYWKFVINHEFGIIMSDDGEKSWGVQNLKLIRSSLQNIDRALNGRLQSYVGGSTFLLGNHVPSVEHPFSTYSGLTSGTTITFCTTGNQIIRQMNIYHEAGHLLDNSSGNVDAFSNALDALEYPGFINNDGVLDRNALRNQNWVNDPTYGHAEAIQHQSTDPNEQWADIFANYVAGNIDLSKPAGPGMDMYNFVTGVVGP